MRDAYGWTCLVLGAALVLAQVLTAWSARTQGAKAEVVQAATLAADAADLVKTAAQETRQVTSGRFGQEGLGDQAQVMVDRLRAAVDDAEDKATEAGTKAEAAKTQAGLGDVLTALAGRAPLALAGGLLLALGAVIMGYLDLSATASTG